MIFLKDNFLDLIRTLQAIMEGFKVFSLLSMGVKQAMEQAARAAVPAPSPLQGESSFEADSHCRQTLTEIGSHYPALFALS